MGQGFWRNYVYCMKGMQQIQGHLREFSILYRLNRGGLPKVSGQNTNNKGEHLMDSLLCHNDNYLVFRS